MILEYAQGTLMILLDKYIKFTPAIACRITYQIVSALAYMHANGVTHRDLKLENILTTNLDPSTAIIKLSDFGLSKDLEEGTMSTACGSPYYVAPEVLIGEDYTSKVDMWSVGVMSYWMLVGNGPFNAEGMELYKAILQGEIDWNELENTEIGNEGKDFVMRCLKYAVEERLGSEEGTKHVWFEGQM